MFGELDISIMTALLVERRVPGNLRKSGIALARELGVDETTVSPRMKRWREGGFLVDYGATVNQTLLGQRASIVRLEIPRESPKEAIF
jgi:DNA-binding Lrp family transcriptional regulator